LSAALKEGPDHDAAYAAVLSQDDEALVTCYTRHTDWARDSETYLEIYPTDAFYRC